MTQKKYIALIGLMGSGKTTIGSKLADKIGYYFIDSDIEIEDCLKKTINEIFLENGEEYFRNIEEKIIHDILIRDEKSVISLGGGAFISKKNRDILKKNSVTIWLDVPIEIIVNRLKNKNNRPLLNSKEKNRRDILQNLYNLRIPIYSLADFRIEVKKGMSQAEIINEIIKLLK